EFICRKIFKIHFATIYEDGGRTLHTHRVAALSILHDPVRHRITVDIAFESIDINADLFRVAFKNRSHIKLFFPVVLVIVDHMVHLPELALQSGGFSGRCGRQCVLVSWHKRELAESYLQLIPKLFFHLFEYRMKYSTRRTLEITK